jgi:amino acid adenylation domain-containing protein
MQNSTSHGFRLSPQQRQIWLSQQAFPDQAFCIAGSFLVKGKLDRERMQRALTTVVDRHEILRTTFARPAGVKTPFQVISEEPNFFWQNIDLRDVSEPQQQERIDAIFSAACEEPLTIDVGPVVRAHFMELSNNSGVLLLTLPAICADSQTLFNLAGELGSIYESNVELDADEVAQYADYAEWHNRLLESVEEQSLKQKAFWKQRQAQSDPVPALPLERRNTGGFGAFDAITLDLDHDLVNRLDAVAVESDVAVSDLLCLAWQSLISRLSGRGDFTIYKSCQARKVEDLRGALGPYDRYVPVQCRLENDLFGRQLQLVTGELRHAADSLEYAATTDEGLLSGKAIAFEFEERGTWTGENLSISVAREFVFINPFKLKLSCKQSDKHLSLQLQYDSHLFQRETCERIIDYLKRLIEALANTTLANRNELKLGTIDILPPSERETLLGLNKTAGAYASDKCVHHFFEEQVNNTPAHVAVVCGNQQLSYEELNIRANRVAHLLRKSGVGQGSCVGMCLTASVDTMIALLGILKSGAAYVPLNPEHPAARLKAQLAKSEAGVCLTNVTTVAEVLEADVRIIHFERDAGLLAAEAHTNTDVTVSSDDVAYVIYTSGSTGTPKGVAVRHRNLVNYTQFMLKRLSVTEPLQYATISTISADLGNTCIFPSLFSGGCLHILRHDVALEPRLFSDYVSRHAIDVLKIAPSHLHALLSDDNHEGLLPRKYLVLGGEAFSRQLLDSILTASPSCKILNHYGPTETTVGSLTFDVNAQELLDVARTVPIGRPIANTQVYILDKHMRLCPTGVAGDLYIGGAGVAAGYLSDPEQTAARFVPDLFSSNPGSRLYRTGDLARHLPGGNIEFLGRGDLQVKVRGYRIELGEIEATLSEHPLIRQAIVVLRHDGGRERLVAYVISSKLRPGNTVEITEFLKERLPDYMVPAPIVVMRAFPTTPNGKVDRSALPVPEEAQGANRVLVAPQTFVEVELAKIWASLLRIEKLSVHDDFFDLGGHSLLATQVVSRVRRVFDKEIPLRSIFDAPTIAKLAGVIEEAPATATVDLQMLEAIESLSDEEAERLLQDQHQGNQV